MQESDEGTRYLWGGKAIRKHLASIGLRMSSSTMYRHIQDNGLPATRSPLGLVTTTEELEDWVRRMVEEGDR